MIDGQMNLTGEEIGRLIAGLGRFMEDSCSGLCLDSPEDRGTLAGKLAAWLAQDKTMMISPAPLLPAAKYRYALDIHDGATRGLICRLVMDRGREMTDGDFMQMQDFMWGVIGRHIMSNPELRRTLELAGIRVEEPTPAQPAPAL